MIDPEHEMIATKVIHEMSMHPDPNIAQQGRLLKCMIPGFMAEIQRFRELEAKGVRPSQVIHNLSIATAKGLVMMVGAIAKEGMEINLLKGLVLSILQHGIKDLNFCMEKTETPEVLAEICLEALKKKSWPTS